MNPNAIRVRRATVEDLSALKAMWLSLGLPAEQLENRLREFQVVERGGQVVGAIGFLVLRTAALLHSEEYSDYSVADTARQMFWDRIQALASNHGVFRLWMMEASPYWSRWGFQPADDEALARLPEEWKGTAEKWSTLELKNEAAINAVIEKQLSTFMSSEKKHSEEVVARTQKITNFAAVIFFLIGFVGIGIAAYLFVHLKTK